LRTEILSQEKNVVAIRAEVEADDFQKSVNRTIHDISQKANVPGFRKGKVPKKVLELRYGKQNLLAETLESLVPDIISDIITDYELELTGEPELKIETMEEGKPLVLQFTFEVVPEVKLPDMEQIEVEKLQIQVTEEMMEETLNNILEKNATLETLEDRSKTNETDLVEVTYGTEIRDDEGKVVKSHEPANTVLDLNQEGLNEEIRKALSDVEIGNSLEVDTPIDENYPEKELAGKTAHYSFQVLSIKKKLLPEMNKDLFNKIGGTDVNTEAEFRDFIRNMIAEHMEQESVKACQNAALQKITDAAELEVPDSMLKRQLENLKKQDEDNIQKRFDKSLVEFLQESSMNPEIYENNLREQAENQVRRYLVIEEIARENQINVLEEDMDRAIENIASQYGVDSRTVKGTLLKDKEKLNELSNEIRYGKILSFLMDKVNVKEVDQLSSEQDKITADIQEEPEE